MLSVSVCAILLIVSVNAWLPLPQALKNAGDHKKVALESCGISKVSYEGDRIVGGRAALEGELPWQISLQRSSWWNNKFSHICGGTVLNERTIITAAHCVDGGVASNFQVVVGAHDINKQTNSQQGFAVSQVIMHEGYNSRTIENDIAILILSSSIQVEQSNGLVNGACLPGAGEEVGGFVSVSGWGATREGGSGASILQTADIPVVTNEKCADQYGAGSIFDGMLCAGIEAGGKDSCQGDSGGPLVKRHNGQATLVGVVSWGYGCARPNYSGVYTRVASYVDWIEKNAA